MSSRTDVERIDTIAGVIVLVILSSILAAAVRGMRYINQPWNDPLPGPTTEERDNAGRQAGQVETLCGAPPSMTIIIIGSDASDDDFGSGFADVIRIAHIDFVAGTAAIVAVPRDLSVVISGQEARGIVEVRLKSAFAYGNLDNPPYGGVLLTTQTLNENFGVSTDRYIVFNRATLSALIDAIDGITVTLDEPVADFPAGPQLLTGEQALRLARLRTETEDTRDTLRIERQTLVAQAILNRMLEPDVRPMWPQLAVRLRADTFSDLTPAEIAMLLCLSRSVSPDQLSFQAMDEALYTRERDAFGQEILIPDKTGITAWLDSYLTGAAQ